MKFKTKVVWSASLDIHPAPKQSVKFNRTSGMAYQPAKVSRYVDLVRAIVESQKPSTPFEGPLELECIFVFPFPKSAKKCGKSRGWEFKGTMPDVDNLSKPVQDAMQGVLFRNDSQLARLIISKINAEQAYVQVILRKLEEEA